MPDLGNAPEGFHDILIKDVSATLSWWSRRLLPGEVTSLRRRWPKICFSDHAKASGGNGAAPPEQSRPPGVGVLTRSSGPLFPMPGIYHDRLG